MKLKTRFKKNIILMICSIVAISILNVGELCSFAEENGNLIEINEANFPDECMRKALSVDYDFDKDGYIDPQRVTSITYTGNFGQKKMKTAEGIQYFTELTELRLDNNDLEKIDVSKNLKLKSLDLVDNKLSSVDISKNIELTDLYLSGNKITNIDISKNEKLTSFLIANNPITYIDLSNNTKIKRLYINHTSISSLNINMLSDLDELMVGDTNIKSIDLSKNIKLKSLYMENDNVSSLSLENNNSLISFYANNGELNSITFPKSDKLWYIDLSNNKIKNIDVSGLSHLEKLNISNNQIEKIDISNNIYLYELYVNGNQISKIDISKNTNLYNINIAGNPINSLDISNNPELGIPYYGKGGIEAYVAVDAHQSVTSTKAVDAICIYVNEKKSNINLNNIEKFDSSFLDGIEKATGADVLSFDKNTNTVSFDFSKKIENGIEYTNGRVNKYSYESLELGYSESIEINDKNEERYLVIIYDSDMKYSTGNNSYNADNSENNIVTNDTVLHDNETFFSDYQGCSFYLDINGNVRCYDSNGNPVINEFKCDGVYTYYFQLDGTAMKDRLTYHPDGVHVIYFDENGHEVFSNFAHVKKSIAGDDVDDLCFFDVYGYMYVNFLTFNQDGTALYYANPYGVMECTGWFQFAGNAGYVAEAYGITEGTWAYAGADGKIVPESIGNYGYGVDNFTIDTPVETTRNDAWKEQYISLVEDKDNTLKNDPYYEPDYCYMGGYIYDFNGYGVPELVTDVDFGPMPERRQYYFDGNSVRESSIIPAQYIDYEGIKGDTLVTVSQLGQDECRDAEILLMKVNGDFVIEKKYHLYGDYSNKSNWVDAVVTYDGVEHQMSFNDVQKELGEYGINVTRKKHEYKNDMGYAYRFKIDKTQFTSPEWLEADELINKIRAY